MVHDIEDIEGSNMSSEDFTKKELGTSSVLGKASNFNKKLKSVRPALNPENLNAVKSIIKSI